MPYQRTTASYMQHQVKLYALSSGSHTTHSGPRIRVVSATLSFIVPTPFICWQSRALWASSARSSAPRAAYASAFVVMVRRVKSSFFVDPSAPHYCEGGRRGLNKNQFLKSACHSKRTHTEQKEVHPFSLPHAATTPREYLSVVSPWATPAAQPPAVSAWPSSVRGTRRVRSPRITMVRESSRTTLFCGRVQGAAATEPRHRRRRSERSR